MFSPTYGQSYYEIFSLGHTDDIVHFTSLHNQPSLRHWLTADMKFRSFALRLGYMADMQQSRVGALRTHDYSHTFMIGLVKKLLPVKWQQAYFCNPYTLFTIPYSLYHLHFVIPKMNIQNLNCA